MTDPAGGGGARGPGQRVLLVHGLGRTPRSLYPLVRVLEREGHQPERFGYVAALESYEQILRRLVGRLRLLARARVPHSLLGHSLGGLLLRAALARLDEADRTATRLIMLGTPNQSPLMARYLFRIPPFPWMAGECGQRLASRDFFARLPVPAVPYTLLAGTLGPRGRWSPFGNAINDGLVALAETRILPEDPIRTFPAWHTFLMNHPKVQAAVLDALGRQDRAAAGC